VRPAWRGLVGQRAGGHAITFAVTTGAAAVNAIQTITESAAHFDRVIICCFTDADAEVYRAALGE